VPLAELWMKESDAGRTVQARSRCRSQHSMRLICLGLLLSLVPFAALAGETLYEFRAASGTTVNAQLGELTVPEHRGKTGTRQIRLRYVRFPATTRTPGAPIVYLAGGPGGSGIETARRERFPMFMALREVADVIALDQRGTGQSNDIPVCDSGVSSASDAPLTSEIVEQGMREAAIVCQRFWRERGVDLAGYTTAENASDLDDLREALGARKITLWGISYGSHLAFAALKQMSPRLDHVVIASGEGLSQTVKMPAHTDAYFARLSAALRAGNPGVDTPDVPALIRRVHARLEREPVTVGSLAIGKYDVQLLAASSIADPSGAVRLIKLYEAMDRGDFSQPAQLLRAFVRTTAPIKMNGMPEAMDIASGISDADLATIREQAKTSLLGDTLNFPMPHLRGALGVPDLGEGFRAPVKTNVPTLLIMGTLDGRTYLEAQAENLSGFTNARQLFVANAGHNVYMTSPEITPAVVAFLRGEKPPARIAIDPPQWEVKK
jgi:pimeloyl-ACP methyl ester carboxylesterase